MGHPVASLGTLDARSLRERLHANSWFGTLSATSQDASIDITAARCLGVGELPFRRGDTPNGLYCVVEGMIRIGTTSADGREVLLVVLKPVDWFNEIDAFDRQSHTHDARADDRTTLLYIPQAVLIASLGGSPALLYAFALLLAHKLRLTFIVLEETTLLPAPVRVARHLLLTTDGYGNLHLDTWRMLHMLQEQLAQLLSPSHQTVNQVLEDFEACGVLKLTYGKIEVLDFSRLHRLGYEM